MRCRACNANLSDLESTRRDTTGSFLDMCSTCLAWVVPFVETSENFLLHDGSVDDLTTDLPGLSGREPQSVDVYPDSDEFDSTEDRE